MMYGTDWQPCYRCGVRSRPEEQEKGTINCTAGLLGQHTEAFVCKDRNRCERFQEEKRRGPTKPPPVPPITAANRRRRK